jgi:hypothetical protein
MPRIALIPTGAMEHTALPASLSKLFPGVEFISLPPDRNLDGFTSTDVSIVLGNQNAPVLRRVDDLAATMVATVSPGGLRRDRCDFAMVIEDLELVNDHQPALVITAFRQAVDRHIAALPAQATRDRSLALIQKQCSFHLLRPMTEAYFFGDPAALQRAAIVRQPQLLPVLDCELFQTTDTDYLAIPAGTRLHGRTRFPHMPDRQRHPKAYLQYLCDPTLADRRLRYRETQNGVSALTNLNWQRVLSDPAHCPFARAFLDDIAYAVNQPLPWLQQTSTVPTSFPGPQGRVLRNI